MNSERRLGISIYPSHQNVDEMKKYITSAHEKGFTRIFASMLELTENTRNEVLKKFKDTFKFAKAMGFDICLDVNPRIFDLIGASPSNLSIFNELNATTVRLDMPMDGKSEAEMTYNEYGLNIEINASNGTAYIQNIISYKPKKDKLIAGHNFYPQRNAGLEYDFFIKATKIAKENGLRTTAFVSSTIGKQGPWNVTDGLPTLEMHRSMPISAQAKHLWALGIIDDIIIGNAFASNGELKSLASIDKYRVTLSVRTLDKTNNIEKKIINLNSHFRRGDINEYTIRSTMSRVWFKDEEFKPHDNNLPQKKGNIYIGNNNFGIYKGELQLIINALPVDNRKNLVAQVIDDDMFLIDYIDSWDKFKFIIEEKHD